MTNTIAIDAMGGDFAPAETVKGCVEALETCPSSDFILVGRESEVFAELNKYGYDKARIRVVHASEVIGFDEAPAAAIRRKKDSSMVVGLNLVKSGAAGAFVSAGSTGALLTGATVIIGRIPGVERPALAAVMPSERGLTLLIDSGANVDCKPRYLLQFAHMGAVYMENVMGTANPRVGLASIGAEKEKGNSLTKEAYELLENSGLNFIGNTEARDIPGGAADVIVCDGFVGNVILKYAEGFAKSMFSIIKTELTRKPVSKLGALLSKSAFAALKVKFDPSEVGGAAFLGLNGLVVKAHGSSDAKAIRNAARQGSLFIERGILEKTRASMGEKSGE